MRIRAHLQNSSKIIGSIFDAMIHSHDDDRHHDWAVIIDLYSLASSSDRRSLCLDTYIIIVILTPKITIFSPYDAYVKSQHVHYQIRAASINVRTPFIDIKHVPKMVMLYCDLLHYVVRPWLKGSRLFSQNSSIKCLSPIRLSDLQIFNNHTDYTLW